MDFLKVAGKEIVNIFKNKFIRISLIALIGVPILYALLYLSAFWDPYGKMEDFPVAVVNLDKGATVDDEKKNFGDEIVNEFKEKKEMNWHFTNEEDANKGLEGSKYYIKLLIPEDFSQRLVSAQDGKPRIASLKITSNPKKNYIGSQIGSSLETKLKESITANITKTTVKGSFDILYDIKDGLVTAADGSSKLNNGIGDLNKNVPLVSKAVDALSKGSSDLFNGQTDLNSGIEKISGGLKEFNENIPEVGNGVKSLHSGSTELKNGIQSAGNGAKQLNSGSEKLYDSFNENIYPAVNELKVGAKELNKSLISGGAKDLSGSSNNLKEGSDKISKSSNEILSGYKEVNRGFTALDEGNNSSLRIMESVELDLKKAIESGDKSDIESALKKIQSLSAESKSNSQKIKELKQGTEGFNSSLKQYNQSIQSYTENVSSYASSTSSLAGNMSEIGKSVNQISNGLDTLEKGLNEKNEGSFGSGLKTVSENITSLNKGIGSLNEGATQINGGLLELNSSFPTLQNTVGALYTGASKLENGSSTLLNGQGKLSSSLKELDNNVPVLQNGVTKLFDGSKELSDKLGEGADEIESGLKTPSEIMSEFVKQPVDVENDPINPVNNYGTVFAPYILPMALWVGSLLVLIVMSLKPDKTITSSKFHTVIGKYLGFGFIGVVQATLTGVTVLCLGLKPTNIPLFFLLMIFFSLVFLAIMYCLISLFGIVGNLLITLILMVQLVSCGGTFPVELTPAFFRAVNPYLPFTYILEALREVISATTINYSVIYKDVAILGLVAIAFLAITIIFKSTSERMDDTIQGKKDETNRIASSLNS